MTATIPVLPTRTPLARRLTGLLWHVGRAWRSVRPAEAGGFLVLGLLFGMVDLTALADARSFDQPWPLFWRLLLTPVVCTAVLLLVWLPADRSDPASPWRPWRLALAAVLGSLLTVPTLWAVSDSLHWPGAEAFCAPKCDPPLPTWQRFAGDFLATLLPGALLVALVEMLRRRWRADAQLQAVLDEQAALGRQAMAARLAAMQAQVEPTFLFEVLVDVQHQYARGTSDAAAAQLERLIHHLRVALPRLREHNATTLDAEAALLGSYLALREGLARQPVAFVDDLPPALRAARLPAMLLLPLLQRALRAVSGPPPAVALAAHRTPTRLVVRLAVHADGLCGDGDELAAERERLRVLAGDGARLACTSGDGRTDFTLEIPA
ncbi:histidine kinase [Ideonella sp.]|uniref:histidine kinase n=1 Tax=Ideonella sp. TaxID=1929293 RepID=UPI0035B20B2E